VASLNTSTTSTTSDSDKSDKMDMVDSPSPSPQDTSAFSLHGILKTQEAKETPPAPRAKTNLTEFLVKW